MLDLLGASALAGLCAKVVDEAIDRRLRIPVYLPIILALLYGFLLGWASSSLLASLFIALALANLLSGKIDHPYHVLGALAFLLALFLFPITDFQPWFFALFLVSGLLDELNLLAGRSNGLDFLNTQRLWTPLAALIATFVWDLPILVLLALLFFDLAYRFGAWLVQLEYPLPAPRPPRVPAAARPSAPARRRLPR